MDLVYIVCLTFILIEMPVNLVWLSEVDCLKILSHRYLTHTSQFQFLVKLYTWIMSMDFWLCIEMSVNLVGLIEVQHCVFVILEFLRQLVCHLNFGFSYSKNKRLLLLLVKRENSRRIYLIEKIWWSQIFAFYKFCKSLKFF